VPAIHEPVPQPDGPGSASDGAPSESNVKSSADALLGDIANPPQSFDELTSSLDGSDPHGITGIAGFAQSRSIETS
jgi:hypothetical protein